MKRDRKIKVELTHRPLNRERARVHRVMALLLHRRDAKSPEKNEKGANT